MEADFLSGIPIAVDPEKIERELSLLWKTEGNADGNADGNERSASFTRTCLSNLIVYLADGAAADWAGTILPEICRRFPSRLIVLLPQTAGSGPLSAWVTARCHLPSPGFPPVCCEEILLRSPGGRTDDFPWAVLALLVPDLPSILVLPGPEGDHLIGPLARAIDRVVFDTRSWRLRDLDALARLFDRHPALGIDDLGWRETVNWRRILGDLYDDPGIREHFRRMDRIEVRHDAAAICPAALMAGWLAARLGWEAPQGGEPGLLRRGHEKLRVAFSGVADARVGEEGAADGGAADGKPARETAAGSIRGLRLSQGPPGAERAFLQLSHEASQSTVRLDHHDEDACVVPRRIPLPRRSEPLLLGSILERPTRREVFEEALRAACRLV